MQKYKRCSELAKALMAQNTVETGTVAGTVGQLIW